MPIHILGKCCYHIILELFLFVKRFAFAFSTYTEHKHSFKSLQFLDTPHIICCDIGQHLEDLYCFPLMIVILLSHLPTCHSNQQVLCNFNQPTSDGQNAKPPE